MSKKKTGSDYVRIIPLGGLDEFGMNCCLIECNDSMVMLDCGLTFPDTQGYGVDYILPDWAYVMDNLDRLEAVVLTHGHEDHIGALPFFLREVDVPVYSGRLTCAMIERKLKEHPIEGGVELNRVEPGDIVDIGPLSFEFVHVNHSIPNAMSLLIGTPLGDMLFTGDWKLDQTPIGEPVMDLQRFARMGTDGLLAVLGDSTNAGVPGLSRSERVVQRGLSKVVKEAPGRVVIAMFSSNQPRVRGIMEIAHQQGRKVAMLGFSLNTNFGLCREHGFMDLPSDNLVINADQIESMDPSKLIVISTGSQAEPRASLPRMAYDDHHHIKLTSADTVVVSARIIPGNETGINQMINALVQRGANVITADDAEIHGSGHAKREEMKLLLNLTRPKYLVPVHGEYRMRMQHAELGEELGIIPRIIGDGDVLEFRGDDAKVVDRVSVGRIIVDGKGVGDVDDVQLRDRRKLAATGIVVVFAVIERSSGNLISGPDLLQRGFLAGVPESDRLLEEASDFARRAVEDLSAKVRTDVSEVQEALRSSLRRYFRKELNRKPVVIPVVHEL